MEFGVGARHLVGWSNPHSLIWAALWRCRLNIAPKKEKAIVKKIMECHGLLGNIDVIADLKKVFKVSRSFGSGSPSPCSSTSFE